MIGWTEALFGSGPDLDTLQMVDRALAVFVLPLAMIRLSGRRSFGQGRPFDTCITVLLGSVLSRAVVGASPFWPAVLACAALVLLHRIVGIASIRSAWFERLVSGDKRELVRNGVRVEQEMRKGLITARDLDEAIRARRATRARRSVVQCWSGTAP